MMRAGLRMLASVLALATVAVASSGEVALASHVSCGDKITADTRLDSDLVDCRNNGIVIAADGVTLNLNGHTIDGDGRPFATCPRRRICDFGVVTVGHDGVTVKSGSVREFDVGVFVANAHRGRVLGVSSSKHRLFGFVVADSARILVRDSSGSGNLAPDGDGMGVFESHHVRILNNSFRRNPLGLHVDESNRILIKGNRFSRNQGAIFMTGSNRSQVRRNRCVGNNTCVLVSPGNRNVIARNRVFRDIAGIWVESGRGNRVAHNVVVDTRVVGIRLGGAQPPSGGANNLVHRNLVRGSTDGFLVDREDDHSLLAGNVAVGAGDDGFDVRSRTTTLTGNRALRNADLGIAAARGVIDGGGNTARGNGDRTQCRNVACG